MGYENEISSVNDIISSVKKDNSFYMLRAMPNQELHFIEKMKHCVYCLEKGEVEIRRNSDRIVLLTIKAPAVIGLTTLSLSECFHMLTTITDCDFLVVEKNKIEHIIDENKLWKQAFEIVSRATIFYYERDEMISSGNVYGVIKAHLEQLWSLSVEERGKISIFKFILTRTTISRSSIHKIIKDLDNGGYIKIHRGKLLDKKTLPNCY